MLRRLQQIALVIAMGVSGLGVSQTQAQADPETECPPGLDCQFIPAAYVNTDPSNPVAYGNYDIANRPHDMAINSVVIHDAEGTCEAVIEHFQNPASQVSTHYMVCADGRVLQFVRTKDVGWHAGNWWFNMHSIGIEHEGHAALGSTEYTPAMYRSSAKLVKWLAAKFKFPVDRQHVIGHDEIPATTAANIPNMHVDPGPFWDWQGYMKLMGAPIRPSGGRNAKLVVIAPVWPRSKLPVEGCWPEDLPSCVPNGANPTNFVYMRTAPSHGAPLVTDPVLGPGTVQIANNAARAFYGQKFALKTHKAASDGIWYQVWYAGQLAWFHSPWKAPTAKLSGGKYLTPKPGRSSVPLYGRPLPEKSDYPADFTPPHPSAAPEPVPLPYVMEAGQRYALLPSSVSDHYFSWTYDGSLPYDRTVFKGSVEYLRVQINGRGAFVKKEDVVVG